MGIPDVAPLRFRAGRQRRRIAGSGRSPPRAQTDIVDLLKWQHFLRSNKHYASDFRPEWFGDKLSRTALVEVLDDGHDYRTLIEGSEISRRFMSSEHRTYRETYGTGYLAEALSFLGSVIRSGNHAHRTFSATAPDGTPVKFSQLAMPSVNRSGIIHRLAIVVDFLDKPTQ